MQYDIITIEPTVTDGDGTNDANAHAIGDVVFNLTEVEMPARACRLINVFMEVANGGGETGTKIGILFFKKNTTPSLGALNATAGITHANFTANEYIGQTFLCLNDGAGGSSAANATIDVNAIDKVALYYGGSWSTDTLAGSADGDSLSIFEPMVLKGDAGDGTIYAAGVIHDGVTDFDGTNNVKIHFHVEY